jgi:hypothetical protein
MTGPTYRNTAQTQPGIWKCGQILLSSQEYNPYQLSFSWPKPNLSHLHSLYTHIPIHTHTPIHTYIHIYTYTHIHTLVPTHTHLKRRDEVEIKLAGFGCVLCMWAWVGMGVCMDMDMWVRIYICRYRCIYMCVCVYVCVCMCGYMSV